MKRVMIPDEEYKQRIARAAKLAGERGLDILVVNGSEADYANTRYLSGFWPVFERAGVAITPSGDCALMVGPESQIFASDFGHIDKVRVLREYRESANPQYPELHPTNFREVFKELGVTGDHIKIGMAAWLDTNLVIYEGIKECYPEAELIRCDDIMTTLRSVKSDNEIACLREAARITEIATQEVIKALRPGVTELQMVGIAQKAIYENGGEYEGLPLYVFSEKSTQHAISRSSYREIQKGDIVQINLAAKIDGYSPSIGMPVSMGPLTGLKKDLVEFCLKAHMWTEKQLKAGVIAADVAKDFIKYFQENGYGENLLYGPCHGLGLIEVEAPWMETISDYPLLPNMTFQIDTFAMGPNFGLRWEKPIVITETGCDLLSPQIGTIHEIEC
ncbi:M24 family metallopeptidase [Diplocloster agilis]|uniref:Xaa-Pro peptidase family protein n=1 Tax=Diplocloster agilis TaxID=2850323 RepID=A0A949JYY5_9FIRM|nr:MULTISPECIES: Xaa-Pro peptidase family protein [Lachnospiraceae]MBU9737798.1 Xaa-Pro peptidase family protein [Diplocloster agilis]MBU9745724.1 Xaa-Pro peptidase family protein [Diplocloster agilis]MCU6735225.1 Xaa-Pro peptidase family protein [Suonthocola fibrivorans]SCJ67908.1 Creatinase [uncultured Clostridium sp.]